MYERCLHLEKTIDELSKQKENFNSDIKELENIKISQTKYIDSCEKEIK